MTTSVSVAVVLTTATVMAVAAAAAETRPGVRHHRIAVRPSADDVLELLRTTDGVEQIRGALRVPSALIRRAATATVGDQTDRWLRRADDLDDRFARAVFRHVDGLLESYCAAVVYGDGDDGDPAGFVDFRVFAFLLDVGRGPVDVPFHVAFFLQTRSPTAAPDDFRSQARSFLDRYYNGGRRDAAGPTADGRRALSDARREIAATSSAFRSSAFAIADHDFFDPGAVDRARRLVAADPFVHRVFRTREFYVVFDYVEGIKTQRHRIIKINYYRTLASLEYESIINESDNQIEKDAIHTSEIKSEILDVRVFTLATLKDQLVKTYAYYLNVVQYYNAVSKVLVLVSIEEGNTMLGGIRNVLADNCMHRPAMPFGEIDMMRTRLFAFKLSFDRLVDLISEKLRIDVTDNTKTAFDRRVTKMLSFLESLRNPKFVRQICLNANDLFDSVEKIEIVKRHDTPSGRTFEEYCFFDPTYNVNKMYSFIRRLFKV